MNRLIILLIAAAFLLPAQTEAQDAQPSAMSLQEAVDYGLVHNQNILNAKLDMVSAEALTKEYLAAGLPQINGSIDIADNFIVGFVPRGNSHNGHRSIY